MNANGETKRGFRALVPHIVRVLYGLGFTVFGLIGLFGPAPDPEKLPMPEPAKALFIGMIGSGYMLKLVSATQFVSGVLLLINRFVPLALAFLAPMIVNIVAFHVFAAPEGTVIALFFAAMEVYLAWCYRRVYYPMLAAVVRPG